MGRLSSNLIDLTLVTIDCNEPRKLAEFWSEVTGCSIEHESDEYVALERPPSGAPRLGFQRVSYPKEIKNRVHPDFRASRELEDEEARLVALGATVIDRHEVPGLRWVVFQDPEGNEFCVGKPS